MPPFLQYIAVFLSACLSAVRDIFTGRSRRRYESSVHIAAPRDTVWTIAAAEQFKFDGIVPMEVSATPRPDGSGVLDAHMKYGEHEHFFSYRVLKKEPPDVLVLELLPHERSAKLVQSTDHYATVLLAEERNGTRLNLIHELTHAQWRGRIGTPLGVLATARRLKLQAEMAAGTPTNTFAERVRDAVITGAITIASFAYLFGWSAAFVLVFLVLIHELGHVLAMRMCGIPVRGIYFVPFFGGVAIGADRYKSEAERGFVAYMGPGLSLFTTAAFWAAGIATGENLWTQLALLSAILNGLNLLPVMPLDGGHIIESLVSRLDADIGDMVHLMGLLLGLGLSVYMGWYLLGALLLFQVPRVFNGKPDAHRLPELSLAQVALLFAAYGGAIAFYAGLIARLTT